MNPEAERLTGWSQAEARQRDLVEVFRIVNEYTRQAVDNPVTAVLRQGTKVGLANHTILLGKPVRMSGVCMDITERKCAEAELQAAFREKREP